MGTITERSNVSLGLVIALALGLSGSLFWTGSLHEKVATTERDLLSHRMLHDREIAELRAVDERTGAQYIQIMVGITKIQVELEKFKEDSRKHKN